MDLIGFDVLYVLFCFFFFLFIEALLPFVQRVKKECPDKDIWVWTGYKLDELDDYQRQMLPYIDVLIDGKFIQEQADPSLVWRGSANQVIYRFKV